MRSCDKYYVLEELVEGTAALCDPVSNTMLSFSFPVDKVSYLGVWVNEGGLLDQYNVALEPCTGPLDDLELAHRLGKASCVKAKDDFDWFLKISVQELEAGGIR